MYGAASLSKNMDMFYIVAIVLLLGVVCRLYARISSLNDRINCVYDRMDMRFSAIHTFLGVKEDHVWEYRKEKDVLIPKEKDELALKHKKSK